MCGFCCFFEKLNKIEAQKLERDWVGEKGKEEKGERKWAFQTDPGLRVMCSWSHIPHYSNHEAKEMNPYRVFVQRLKIKPVFRHYES